VLSAHASVDASIFSNYNRLNVSAAIAMSQHSRVIVVIQEDHSDSIGELFVYSETHFGHGPLILSANLRPSSADVAEIARAQRVGGWVLVQIFQEIDPVDMQWLQDLMPRRTDIQCSVGTHTSSEDSRRSVPNSQFRLWIICSGASLVPIEILESAHIIVHESAASSFASTAAAVVEAASNIRDKLSPKCSLTLRSMITTNALLHALFSFKAACSASLSKATYDTYPSLPAMRIQISYLLSFSRANAAFRTQKNRLLAMQRSLHTPSSQSSGRASSHIVTSTAASNSATGNESEIFSFFQMLCGGCGLLIGCCGAEEQKRLLSLAETICKGCDFEMMSSSLAIAMSLPLNLILAAETCDSVAVANFTPVIDLDCAALGPDVMRVLRMQQSSKAIAELRLFSAMFQKSDIAQHSNAISLQHDVMDRLMVWLERSAPQRPNVPEDFLGTETDIQNNFQSESESIGNLKFFSSASQSGTNETDAKCKPMKPQTPPFDFKTQTPFKAINPIRPAVNAVFLTLHEILLALPEPIGMPFIFIGSSSLFIYFALDAQLLHFALQQNVNLRHIERLNVQESDQNIEVASVAATSKIPISNHPPAFLTRPFAIFLMKELQQWNGAIAFCSRWCFGDYVLIITHN
jgi:hypothetical protein